MKKILGIVVLGLLLNGCSKKPETAFQCYDPQTNERKFALMYDYPWSRIFSPTDWKYDGLSNFNEDFWEPYREKPIHKDSGIIIEFFEDININRVQKNFTITKGKNKGNTYSLPLTNYRNIYFNSKTNEYKIYEYYHPIRVSLENIKQKVDDYGLKINLTFQKTFKCKEDKELYKAWVATGAATR